MKVFVLFVFQSLPIDLYYDAIHDAKLDIPTNEIDDEIELPGFSVEEFNRWANKIDIYTQDKDISTKQHDQIAKEFDSYRYELVIQLADELTYDNLRLRGQLKDIASCIDGSKVGSSNEKYSLYVIHNLTVEKSNNRGLYHVYLGKDPIKHEIQPRRLCEQFAETFSKLICTTQLPDFLKHGGYNSSNDQCHQQQPMGHNEQLNSQDSGYSGVRYNGPAVTSQFRTKAQSLLTWDITPVVALSDADIQAMVRKSDSLQAFVSDNPDKLFLPSEFHLFPDATTNLFGLTTAHMETDLVRTMSTWAPFNEASFSCKELSNSLRMWNSRNGGHVPPDVDIVGYLNQYNTIEDPAVKSTAAEILNRKLRFAHIWIPTDRRKEFNEETKSDISINSAAVTHILLKAASRQKGAFGPRRNPDLVKRLIHTTFEELSNGETYSTEHAFIPRIWISHFSVTPSMAYHKQLLARDISQQCRILGQDPVKDVRINGKLKLRIH